MEPVKVCRICLAMNVKVYDLGSYPLKEYFEQTIGINPFSTEVLPPYICYLCAALVKKYSTFKEKCLKGETAFYSILHEAGKITEEDILKVDRQKQNLVSNLSIHKNIGGTIEYYTYNEPMQYEVKLEPFAEGTAPDYGVENSECIKEEEYEGFNVFLPSPTMSSDDEPLSIHKTNKEKVNTKTDKKKEVPKSGVEEGENSLKVTVLKGKRGCPKKNKVHVKSDIQKKPKTTIDYKGGMPLDDTDITHYVTIIQLSVEEQLAEIEKRKQSSNYLNAPYQCNYCYKGFINTDAWQHHIGKHEPSAGDVECPICKIRFKSRRNLMKHASNHEKKYKCKACPYVSKTATQAKQHQRWHKGVTYKCQYCDEISTKWTSHLSHVRIKHPSEYICGICGYSFVSQLGLTMHRTMMHKDLEKEKDHAAEEKQQESGPYCEECDVKFVSVEAYKRHMVTSSKHAQSERDQHGCRACGETFGSAEALRLHHRGRHARARPRNYGKPQPTRHWPSPCDHCGEEISNAREYWVHFRRVHPDKNYPVQKNYVCDICGKSFRGNAFLVYHKRTHTEERAYKCPQCPKAFHNRTNLQLHQRTHSDLRPHPCSVCFKAFKSKGALDRHFRSHTGEKPYECEVCGKGFGQSNSRKLHVRTVHLKQPAPYVSRARLERRRQRTALLPTF